MRGIMDLYLWESRENKMITIKPFTTEDVEYAVEIFTDEIVKKTYMLPDFETREKAVALFERMKELSYEKDRFVRGIYLSNNMDINNLYTMLFLYFYCFCH